MFILKSDLSSVDINDIERLICDHIPESKNLEYKERSYGSADEDKKELCKDVSAFANAVGGDIVLGIKEDKSGELAIVGIENNPDKEILRLEHILRAYIEPRLNTEIKPIPLDNNKHVLIIRVRKSFLGPHFVKKNGDNFCVYSRTSKGVSSLGYLEIRDRFRAAETLNEEVHKFRLGRVAKLLANETPIPFQEGAKVILHLIPQNAFYSGQRYDLKNATLPLL